MEPDGSLYRPAERDAAQMMANELKTGVDDTKTDDEVIGMVLQMQTAGRTNDDIVEAIVASLHPKNEAKQAEVLRSLRANKIEFRRPIGAGIESDLTERPHEPVEPIKPKS